MNLFGNYLFVICLCMSEYYGTLSYLHLAREEPDMSFLVQIVIVIMHKLSLCKFECPSNTL